MWNILNDIRAVVSMKKNQITTAKGSAFSSIGNTLGYLEKKGSETSSDTAVCVYVCVCKVKEGTVF